MSEGMYAAKPYGETAWAAAATPEPRRQPALRTGDRIFLVA
ncbi:MAG: hypothetical protein ACREOL_00085 [Candidatus Dormibacteria bacterium]